MLVPRTLLFILISTIVMVHWGLMEDIPSYLHDHGYISIHDRGARFKQYTGHIVVNFNNIPTNVCSIICRYDKILPHFPVWSESVGEAKILLPEDFNTTLGANYTSGNYLLLSRLISNF